MKKPKQLKLDLPGPHGGRRKGAGRPNRSGLRAHERRPKLSARVPVHVTLKLRSGLPSFRRKDAFRLLRRAVKLSRRKGLRVVHFSLLSNHLHLIIEPDATSLANRFQSLCVSFAKNMNHSLRLRGRVFKDRYHLRELHTPREVRNALGYVLTNESRHLHPGERRFRIRYDTFSSAFLFRDWQRLLGAGRYALEWGPWPPQKLLAWYSDWLFDASSWLLRVGWTHAPPHRPA